MAEQPLWLWMKRRGFREGDVLAHLGMREPPIDPWAIAREIGVEVVEVDAPGWDGALQSDETRAVAWLKRDEHPVRKRFTLAHELGHLLLHPTGLTFRDTSFSGDARETEANLFAAGLLMPMWVLDPIAHHLKFDVEALCEAFQVSRAAMRIRLQRMGFFA